MDKAAFYFELDQLLELPPGSVQGDQALKRVRHWDSLAVVSFIVLAGTKYGVSLEPNQVGVCETVNDLARCIEDQQKKDRSTD